MSTTYVVKSGDTLSGIASKYNVSGGYLALAKYNGISNPNQINIGQKITIPNTTSASSSSSSASSSNASSSNSGSVGVGSKVKITGSKYATGQSIPNWVKSNTYTVSQISGSKALIKEIVSWVYIKDLNLVSGGASSGSSNSGSTNSNSNANSNSNTNTNTNNGGAAATSSSASSLATSHVNFGDINSNPRTEKVSKITIHHMAGNMDPVACAKMHKNGKASANYYVGTDGSICSGVAENRRAWTSSSGSNDQKAITMEVANNGGDPNWTVSDAAYNSMIALCRDICSRYGITPQFDNSSSGSLTAHYMFSSTLCPGPYLTGKLKSGEIANAIKGNKQPTNTNNNNNSGSSNSGNSGSSSSTAVQTYTVKSGDTLSKIASMFSVPGGYQALASYNNIANPNNISVGQVLKIPSGSTKVPTNNNSNSGGSSSGSTKGGYPAVATQNIKPIYDYLTSQVFNNCANKKALACGFLGNIYTESHYQPDAEQNFGSATKGGKGIVQWDDRKYNLFKFCGGSYEDKNKWVNLDKQLQFIKHELEGSESTAFKRMKEATSGNTEADARTIAYNIAKNYERCAVPSNPERQDKAAENFRNL